MESKTFLQSCPVCGRRLVIDTIFAGHEVNCYHCHAKFESMNRDTVEKPASSLETLEEDAFMDSGFAFPLKV